MGYINPILSQSEALKELESESSLNCCKSEKPLSSTHAFGSDNWDLEAELHKNPANNFKPTHKIAIVVDRMGSEKPSISRRKNDVHRSGGGEGGSGLSPVLRNSQSMLEIEDGAMYIAGGFGIDGGSQEVSRVDFGFDSTETYFQKMLEANLGNSLLLRSYAKFLREVQGNLAKVEEYYERSILASPGDGEVLSLYAKLMWEVRRDALDVEAYFDQAVQASPDDCFILGSYAHFLWDSEKGEAGDTNSETQHRCRTSAPVMLYNSATETIV